METTRIRKANAVVKEKGILYFAQDRDVSTCMLAILSVSKTKSGVGSVGRKLTNKEFVELYPKQCNIFKEIFKDLKRNTKH